RRARGVSRSNIKCPKCCGTLVAAMNTAIGIAFAVVFSAALGLLAGSLWRRAKPDEVQPPQAAPQPEAAVPQPLADALARLETLVRESDLQRQHTLGGLEHHLATLNKETAALSHALRAPHSRGRWGELTLRRVAELSGMVPYCDFDE